MSRLATLHEVALLLAGELDRGRLFDGLCRGAARMTGALAAAAYSCDTAGEHIVVEARLGDARPLPRGVVQALSERRTVAAGRELATPLLCQGVLLGALWAQGSFGPDDATLLETLAVAVAAALTYAETIASAERRQAQAEALLQAYRSVVDARDRDTIMARGLDAMTTVLGADSAAIYLVDRQQRVTFVMGRRVSRQYLEAACRNISRSAGGIAAQARVPVHVADVRSDPRTRPVHQEAADAGIRTLLIVPLLNRDELLGGIVLYHDIVLDYAPDDIALARGFAEQVSVALATASLTRRLEQRLTQARILASVVKAVTEPDTDGERVSRAVQAIVAGGAATQAWVFSPDGALAAQAGMSAHSRDEALEMARAARGGRALRGELAAAGIGFRGEHVGGLVLAAPSRAAAAPARPQTVTIQIIEEDDGEERLELATAAAERLGGAMGGAWVGHDAGRAQPR
jgi:GAF domain-containing protein